MLVICSAPFWAALSTGLFLAILSMLFSFAGLVAYGLCIYRMFSRNLDKRRAENRRYVTFHERQKKKRNQAVNRFRNRKIYKYFKCPGCKAWLRLKRGSGVVTITCEESDVTILYAINGDPLEGRVYAAPFEVAEDAVVSAVAVRSGKKAELSVKGTSVAQSQMRVVSRRYYNENGVELTSPEVGVTIVAVEYEDGTTRVYKMVRR